MVDELFVESAIDDDLLRVMFSCCQPALSEEAQVALILHILCGFGVSEVAAAFLSTEAAIQKRISRAKKVLAGSERLFDLADADFAARLSAVHRALYLLFNEGYHGASAQAAVQVDLCREATRLVTLLVDHAITATPGTYALAALMCLHGAPGTRSLVTTSRRHSPSRAMRWSGDSWNSAWVRAIATRWSAHVSTAARPCAESGRPVV
jgi:predicted RNA polymerase sigma factor